MRLIDADRLLQHTKFYNLKNRNRAIDEIDILHAPTVEAIPLDEVKQARINIIQTLYTERMFIDKARILGILNRLIERED